MKYIIFPFLLGLLFNCSKHANHITKQPKKIISLEETREIIETLSADDMAGRDSFDEGYLKSAEYAEEFFKKSDISPVFETYRDSFDIEGKFTFNVVGKVGDFQPGRETIILSAHLDHIGKLDSEVDSIYNGANDNASGVTAVMQIGKFLTRQNHDYNIILALFSAEEKGLVGSRYFAKSLSEQNMKPSLVINFEMIGTSMLSKPGKVYLTGYKLSDMAKKINESLEEEFVVFFDKAEEYNLFRRSDNYPLYEEFNIPSQTISSFDFQKNSFYHHEDDEIENLDIENMNIIIQQAAQAISKILDDKILISLNK